jgi:ribosomal protein S18 acetylase RimI-like enzyme
MGEPANSPISIRQATTPDQLSAVAACFRAYVEWLGEDISFQNYESELKSLPGKYSDPAGALLLATDSDTGQVLGCIALRPVDVSADYRDDGSQRRYSELKRLFVYPEARGRRVARALIREAVGRAREQGYDEVVLDTLARMTAAIGLYKSEGFQEVGAYYHNPLSGVVYMGMSLR